ncbi:MATE family efflux transporter [Croceivirga lutea]|uniref:MATE family efflux transporter n=1 Tax=Croceivirga lutea TaxID=1775167 RepID=UPI00163A0516|nr:MATE family efflux transporter [Croceivirga lutea]GGG38254.1 MATE family efflux transporter [Croceivirga lutea]
MKTKLKVEFISINRLAIPATISGIAEPLLSITDTAVVGNIPIDGLESLAAAGIVGSFLSMLIWVLGQTRSAISAIISQYLGANKLNEVRDLPAQAIFLNITLSLVILLSTFFIAEDIFRLFEAKGKILSYAVDYYKIRVWGFPLTLFTFAVFGIFRGLQNTFYPMLVAIIGAVLNIVLDFILVYGVEDVLPPMYLKGAAWASLIAQAIMALLAFILLKVKSNISLKLTLPFNKELPQLIYMSLNLFVRTLALNLALMLAVREATSLGDRYIGAHTIAINLWLFSAFFIDGYSAAGNSMAGRLLGSKDYQGLWSLAKKVNVYGSVVSLVLLFFGFVFYNQLGRLFSQESEVLTAFYQVFYLVLLALPINTIAFLFDGIFKGMGKMKFLRNVLLIATLLGFIPTLYIGKYLNLGLHAIWIAFIVWMVLRGAPLVIKFRNTFKPLLKES